MVRMLCEEFGADVGAPSGGAAQTPLHLCARNGEEELLRYLVEARGAVIRANALGETPLDIAERATTATGQRCAAFLREHLALAAPSTSPSYSFNSSPAPSLGVCGENLFLPGSTSVSTSNVLRQTRVHHQLNLWSPFTIEASSPPLVGPHSLTSITGDGSAHDTSHSHVSHPPLSSSSYLYLEGGTLTSIKRPYFHRDLTGLERLPDDDLQGFREAYRSGFTFTQCRHHYEIRGLLPYNFENVIYYTPVILFVDHTAMPLPSSSSSQQLKRYRALIDLQNLSAYAISRKALYIDPLSGAIIPSAQDLLVCRNLTDFVRVALIQNFERVPPMVVASSPYAFPFSSAVGLIGSAADRFRYHCSQSSPVYFRDVLEKRTPEWHLAYRILQDFSRFGDSLFKYDIGQHVATGYIPILREIKKSGEASSSLARVRDHFYNASSYLEMAPASSSAGMNPCGNSSSGSTTTWNAASSDVIEAELMLMIPVKLVFLDPHKERPLSLHGSTAERPPSCLSPGANPTQPRVYLLDVAEGPRSAHPDPFSAPAEFSSSSTSALNYACFKTFIQDKRTGLVRPEIIASACASFPDGAFSLYEMLVFLQGLFTKALEEFLGKASLNSPPASPTASRKSWWDELFEVGDPSSPPRARDGGEGGPENCLLCRKNAATVVLLPCWHRPLCGACAAAYKLHCRGGVRAPKYAENTPTTTPQGPLVEAPLQLDYFSCPVCRKRALGTEEIAA
ncbi:unnamed protein product [Phytomonas sp. Hart1]|nr:unnamed protein product [Phytomonas sp. Hart1]|eukprot:CCW70407.1 unnamed protein product [Phytomonas sp. isolate Hart1]